MVVLDKVALQAGCFFKGFLVEALKKEATIVAKHPRLNKNNIRNTQFSYLLVNIPFALIVPTSIDHIHSWPMGWQAC